MLCPVLLLQGSHRTNEIIKMEHKRMTLCSHIQNNSEEQNSKRKASFVFQALSQAISQWDTLLGQLISGLAVQGSQGSALTTAGN